jgi:hypothetical protein
LRAVCTSWDSGEFDPIAAGLSGWQVRAKHAVSPVVEGSLVEVWPRSSCGYDEWYFFDQVPEFVQLDPICNWGMSLADARELREVPSGFDLLDQLDKYVPRAVLGEARRVFAISQDQGLLTDFEEECGRRRTRG